MIEKSSVKFVLKKGVSKGSELGFELEVNAVEGITKDELWALCQLAKTTAEDLYNQEMRLK